MQELAAIIPLEARVKGIVLKNLEEGQEVSTKS